MYKLPLIWRIGLDWLTYLLLMAPVVKWYVKQLKRFFCFGG